MILLRSLRSTLIVASILWTAGLLMLLHLVSVMFFHVFPRFNRHDAGLPIAIGLLMMLTGVLLLRQGLARFAGLRGQLTAVRSGEQPRVAGQYPSEVQPLVDDLNRLLEAREKAVQRALATAGDLAHGLKTPLALLNQQVDRARDAGQTELAESLAQQVDRMDRQVGYHLARARAVASGANGTARTPAEVCVDGLLRTMNKLHAQRRLTLSAGVAPQAVARVQLEDLEEMLGNLLDNACRWANGTVRVEVTRDAGTLVFAVTDDGPGLTPAERELALRRGVRLDEATPGSGLGLAIVRDLAELYGGSLTLAEAAGGGLSARLVLPAA